MQYISVFFLLWAASVAAHAAADAGTPAVELDRIVAIVNDDVITRTELDAAMEVIRGQIEQGRMRTPPDDVLERQVLERMVTQQIQLQLAERTGIRVDDNALNRALSTIAAQNGLSLSEFRDVLENDGFSFEAFREDMRDEITISRLHQRQIESQIMTTEGEVDRFLETQKTQGSGADEYRLGHILVAIPEAASPDRIQSAKRKAEEVLERLTTGADFTEMAIAYSDSPQALEGGDLGWRGPGELPTLFAGVVPRMSVGQVSEILRSPSGFHIIKLLDHRGADRHIVTQTHARHILIKTNELITDDDAVRQLDGLREQVLAGADFAELAIAHSDDSGSARKGGDLGWVAPGETVRQFEDVMAKLDAGQVSKPVQSEFGWHIIQVLERREHDDTENFERNKARELLHKRKRDEETQTWLRRLRDEAFVEYRL